MWATRMISDDGLFAKAGGFELDIRIPWYRSLQVATFRDLKLVVDGTEIANDDIRIRLNDVSYALPETDKAPDEVLWHVQDSGWLEVSGHPVTPGRTYDVDLTLTIQVPYARTLALTTQSRKSLRASQE